MFVSLVTDESAFWVLFLVSLFCSVAPCWCLVPVRFFSWKIIFITCNNLYYKGFHYTVCMYNVLCVLHASLFVLDDVRTSISFQTVQQWPGRWGSCTSHVLRVSELISRLYSRLPVTALVAWPGRGAGDLLYFYDQRVTRRLGGDVGGGVVIRVLGRQHLAKNARLSCDLLYMSLTSYWATEVINPCHTVILPLSLSSSHHHGAQHGAFSTLWRTDMQWVLLTRPRRQTALQ